MTADLPCGKYHPLDWVKVAVFTGSKTAQSQTDQEEEKYAQF